MVVTRSLTVLNLRLLDMTKKTSTLVQVYSSTKIKNIPRKISVISNLHYAYFSYIQTV